MSRVSQIPALIGMPYPQASFVLDFTNNYYRGSGAQGSSPSALPGYNFTRALAAYAEDTAGNLILFPSGVPRITNKGVLIEESRTNLLTYSTGYTSWITGGNATVTNNAGLAPDGSNTADKIVVNAGTNSTWAAARGSAAITPGTTYTTSIFVKPSGYTRVQFTGAVFNGGQFNDTLIDLTTNTVVAGGAGVVFSFASAANGYTRISGTWTATADGTPLIYIKFVPSSVTNINQSYTADGVSGGFFWGAQLEAGSFPTSYIPTTSASVTRPADVFYYTGQVPAASGTLAASGVPSPTASFPRLIGTNTGDAYIFQSSSAANNYGTYNGTTALTKSGSAASSLAIGAVSWGAAGRSVTYNGLAPSSDAGAITSGAATSISVGSSQNGATDFWNSYVQRVAIYPFAASDAQLQSISSGNF